MGRKSIWGERGREKQNKTPKQTLILNTVISFCVLLKFNKYNLQLKHQSLHQYSPPSTDVPSFPQVPQLVPVWSTFFLLHWPSFLFPNLSLYPHTVASFLLKSNSLGLHFSCRWAFDASLYLRYKSEMILSLPLTNFTQHDTLYIQSCSSKLPDFIFFFFLHLSIYVYIIHRHKHIHAPP